MIVYASEDDGALYHESIIDVDPVTKQAEGYRRYEIPDTITLSAEQCLGSYGAIVEILARANQIQKL